MAKFLVRFECYGDTIVEAENQAEAENKAMLKVMFSGSPDTDSGWMMVDETEEIKAEGG